MFFEDVVIVIGLVLAIAFTSYLLGGCSLNQQLVECPHSGKVYLENNLLERDRFCYAQGGEQSCYFSLNKALSHCE